MASTTENVLEVTGIRVVRDGKVQASLECDPESGSPVLRLFDGEVPAVQIGIEDSSAYIRVGGQPGEGCVRIEYTPNISTHILIEHRSEPAIHLLVEGAGGRRICVYDQNLIPVYAAGLSSVSMMSKPAPVPKKVGGRMRSSKLKRRRKKEE